MNELGAIIMSKILVFGHQNPDTDAIGAAIAFAHLQKQLEKIPKQLLLEHQTKKRNLLCLILNLKPRV